MKSESGLKNLGTQLRVLLLTTASVLGACSEQAFLPGTLNAKQNSPGTYLLPAKVDIILAEDDTPSMYQAMPTIQAQIPQFLERLESSGWDYRFVVSPLSRDRAFSQILPSKYDANWISSGKWLEPFPGADPTLPGMAVLANLFATPASYHGFLSNADINWSVGQYENGFQTIQTAITQHAANAQLIRNDAMLAVIVLGNGNDGSGLNLCNVAGWAGLVPCENDPYCAPPYSNPNSGQWHANCENPPSGTSSFNAYNNFFSDLDVGNNGPKVTQSFKFYSIVSKQNTPGGTCIQSNSTYGSRYISMAQNQGGKVFDICTTPIVSALDALSNELISVKMNFVTRYLVIGQEPEVSTIQVVRYLNGDPAQPQVIPNDPVNGWTYVGGPSTVYTIDQPVQMNEQTGYIIELHGTGKIVGNDGAEVHFQLKGGSSGSG